MTAWDAEVIKSGHKPSDEIIQGESLWRFRSSSSEGTERNLCYLNKRCFAQMFLPYAVTTNTVFLFKMNFRKKVLFLFFQHFTLCLTSATHKSTVCAIADPLR